MSTYEYKCLKCGHKFEKVMSIEAHDKHQPECPKCKSREVEHAFSPFYAKTTSKT